MAFPNSTDQAAPAATDSPGLGDDQIRALKLFLEDVLGITDATSYTAGAVTYQTNGRWTALTRWSLREGAAIASAAALTPGTDGNLFHITGTTGMTSIASIDGAGPIWLVYDDAVVITHNATSLILKSAANYTTVAGDVLCFMHEGSGNWRELGNLTVFEAHRDASAAVHGLPASVNVLGNRSAAGEFIQRGTVSIATTGAADTAMYPNTANVTFAVAFSTTPYVVASGTATSLAAGNFAGADNVSTTGFQCLRITPNATAAAANIQWIALGT